MSENTSKIVRLGVLGCGGRMRGILKRLLETDTENQIRIISAFDPFPESLNSLREMTGYDFETASTEDAVIDNPEVDWIFIGSWNSHHSRQVVRAMNAGKDIFCEKPMATTLEECLAIRDASEKFGRTFSLGLVLRYSAHYAKLKEILESGRIGKIISMEFNETLSFNHGGYIFGNWRRLRENAGTHLLEKCCHDIDLINWLLGSVPVRAASFGGKDFFTPENAYRRDELGKNKDGQVAYEAWPDPQRVDPFDEKADIFDNQVAILQYANGVRATFHTNCQAAIRERRIYFVGTHGALRADLVTGKIEVANIGWDDEIETIDTHVSDGHGGGDNIMSQALLRTLLHQEKPLASVREGLCSSIAVFGIDQAADESTVVDLSPLWEKVNINPYTVFQE